MQSKTSKNQRRGSTARFTDKERKAHLAAWAQSGLSGTEYARQHKLSDKILYSWRARFDTDNTAHNDQTPVPTHFVSLDVPGRQQQKVTLKVADMELSIDACSSTPELIALLKAFTQEVAHV